MTLNKMTADEFIAKYPDTDRGANDGCLQNIGCPNCGQRDRFTISFTGTAEVYDKGSDDCGDHEWDGDSACSCADCGHSGKVADFTFEGLDE